MEANCPFDNEIKHSSTTPITPMCTNQLDLPNFSLTQDTLSKFLVDVEDSINDTLQGIVTALETDLDWGIHGDIQDLYRRHTTFGSNLNFEHNNHHQPHSSILTKDFFMISLEAFKDTTVILLLCCAILSLVIDIKRNGTEVGFRDGAMLFLTIFIMANFGTLCKFCKARIRMFKKLSLIRTSKSSVTVVRGGRMMKIPISEIVVGDILFLKTGDQVPADGLLIYQGFFDNISTKSKKCFSVFSGEKVVEGNCKMLVMSVGKNTEISKLMKSTKNTCDGEESKLQAAIGKMNSRLERIWLSLSLLILVVQVIRCFALRSNSCCDSNHNLDPKGVKNTVEDIMNEATKLMVKRQGGVRANGLVALVCILIFALRDGLPLGILILLVFASKKMKPYGQALVRKLSACATLGLVTTICTTMDVDHTKMADLWVGQGNTIKEVSPEIINREVLDTFREGVCINACGPEEDFLLWWAKQGLGCNTEKMNQSRTILYREAYDFNMNRCGLSLRRKKEEVAGNLVHVHWKGDPETILCMCSHYYDADGSKQILDEQKRAAFNEIVSSSINNSSDTLGCFAFAYKQVFVLEEEEEDLQETVKPVEEGLTLLGMVVLKNPYPTEVREVVKTCTQEFRVNIKLLVGGDIKAARLMATQLGIVTDGAVIDASEFQNSTEKEREKMIDKIHVMANSSPSDKLLMVQCLRRNGEVVAVTGTTIRDSPVLKEADVGLFMCGNDSEMAKENADMIILEWNFATVCEILKMGRCVCNSIGKFLELQLTLNIAAFVLNLVVAVSTSEVPLSLFQLLWVNLIMDVLGALALAAVYCSGGDQAPKQAAVYGAGPIITKSMWRNITVQSGYQVIVLLILYLKGNSIFDLEDRNVLEAIIFNCYALCQFFVLINAIKKREKSKKIWWFIIILGSILILQAAVVEFAAAVAHTGKISLKLWCICFGIASASLLIDIVAKWVSNALLIFFFFPFRNHVHMLFLIFFSIQVFLC